MIVGGNFRKCDWFKSIIYIPTALNGTKYFMDKRSGFETIIHWSFQESVRWCSFHVNKSCWEIWYDIFVYFQVDKLKKILVRCQSLETVYWIYSDRTAWQSLRTIFVISTIYGLHCSILKAFVWKPHKNDIKNCTLFVRAGMARRILFGRISLSLSLVYLLFYTKQRHFWTLESYAICHNDPSIYIHDVQQYI